VKVLHWYYDIMNLYGEYGNVKIIEKYLKTQFDEVIIDYKTIGDNLDISQYDIIYIGCGTEKKQLVVLEDMRKYIIDLGRAIEDNKIILATGNSWELFGNEINFSDNSKIEALQIFNYNTYIKEERIIKDIIYNSDLIDKYIVGSINKMSSIDNIDSPLFKIKYGIGNNQNDDNEGFIHNNFYGTHVLGPILMKNPYLLEYIIKKECENKNVEYKKIEFNEYEIKSYEISLKELTNVYEK